ncbi:hypothetical protein J2R78_007003 [Bradyrhizobium sp. USDA 4538]|uniref:hypothetical protein n=1 Tax=unclassified Bradyrhizobium TaxID=2631580 RepID=UPI00209F8919|nr:MULTISPECIES: hypothetical protein [unclassified Bradyrhizobium]MCP1844036.1 hypothetical protein [Bradyrhizobium sp. USDA 4538]MCP1904602.1 hypothetical protein [Bradyrhizobium sp. USDA 4537]MCP1989742.1 hypothetical protein [Bradyrhizobium sp. USDA 4539]
MSPKEGTPEAERQEEERREKASNERGLVLATWILALVTGLLFLAAAIQAGLFVWQLGYMREGMKDATLAASAAKESADAAKLQAAVASGTLQTMQDTAERQLRAYVGVDNASIKQVETGSPEVAVYIKNFGQTPAHDVKMWIHMWIERHPLRVKLPEPPPDLPTSTAVLYPGSEVIFYANKIPPVPAPAIPALGTAEGTVYVYGAIRYRDVFGRHRTTKYRLMHGGREPSRNGLMKRDHDGNEAD